jgi:hypothetical protein
VRERIGERIPPAAPPQRVTPVRERLGGFGHGAGEAARSSERDRIERERVEKVARERAVQERAAREREEAEQADRVRRSREREDAERAECLARERIAAELASRELADRERAAHVRVGTAPTSALAGGRGTAPRMPPERCIIYRTPEVDDSERALRWSLVAYVTGSRRSISNEAAADMLLERFPELQGHVSVHRFWPADFLLVFDSRARRDMVVEESPVDGRGFALRCSPWNRQLQATRHNFRYRAHMEITGIPHPSHCLERGHCPLHPWLLYMGGAAWRRDNFEIGHGALSGNCLDRRAGLAPSL